jgi:putative NIF3 family GTP cyclohydrolase 1 type 2
MLVCEAVERIKKSYLGLGVDMNGVPITHETSRDRYLFGDCEQAVTGIGATCFASVNVIEKAIKEACNLIICHEALFYNHGDKTDWLKNNEVFRLKSALLEKHGIVIWRCHDYIHAGTLEGGKAVDGIFLPIAKQFGWQDFIKGSYTHPIFFELPGIAVSEIANLLTDNLGIDGLRIIGDTRQNVKRCLLGYHILGNDNDLTNYLDIQKIDALIAMETVDYTTLEYVRDAACLGIPKTIFSVGHFNLEEIGMKWMVTHLNSIFGSEIKSLFIPSGSSYTSFSRNSTLISPGGGGIAGVT